MKETVEKNFVVYVSYPVRGMFGLDHELDSLIERLALACDGERSGGGSGFGMRDLDYVFLTPSDALKFRTAVRQSDIKGVKVS